MTLQAQTSTWSTITNVRPGQEVLLHGYLGQKKRMGSGLSFVTLESPDLMQSLQMVVKKQFDDGPQKGLKSPIFSSRQGSPVSVRGIVKNRVQKPGIPETSTREVSKRSILNLELQVTDGVLLNTIADGLMIEADKIFSPQERHLEIRAKEQLRHALQTRSKVASLCRQVLIEDSFVEIETPLLFKSTPEGAREFLVPTRQKHRAYALPQSPQQYKQILMASGIPRYFQLARCFRDEDLRADRQPEFTQIDLEMSFVDENAVMAVTERLVSEIWRTFRKDVTIPDKFDHLTYDEAMSRYGTDKPDRRYGMELHDVTAVLRTSKGWQGGRIEAFKFSCEEDKRKELEGHIKELRHSYMRECSQRVEILSFDEMKGVESLSEATSGLANTLNLQHGDYVVLLQEDNTLRSGGWTSMGRIRDTTHKFLVAKDVIAQPAGFDFLWVVDFPLFSPSVAEEPGQGGTAGLAATHHPFTAPKTAEDLDLLTRNPLTAKAAHYDIVVNGVELGGGSRRIHHGIIQEYILREILKVPEQGIKSLQHLLDALKTGCPPHAGIALGFDRLMAVLLGHDSVKDVIAFPKNNRGQDLMVGSPNLLRPEQLTPYRLAMISSKVKGGQPGDSSNN